MRERGGTDLAAAARDLGAAGVLYVTAVTELTLDLAAALAALTAERARKTLRGSNIRFPVRASLTPSTASSPLARDTVGRPETQPTILIEAEAGKAGVGVLLVENRGPKRVSAVATASTVVDPSGRQMPVEISFEPHTLELAPAEQAVVQILVIVDDSLEPGIRYVATVSLPGLSDHAVPLVVRRRVSPATEATAATAAPTPKRTARRRPSRATPKSTRR
jgi:hypothetical protein